MVVRSTADLRGSSDAKVCADCEQRQVFYSYSDPCTTMDLCYVLLSEHPTWLSCEEPCKRLYTAKFLSLPLVTTFSLFVGSPSLCYRHIGDGVCEAEEVRSSPVDCGFYTPPGYRSQWAVSAEVSDWCEGMNCPPQRLVGSPPLEQVSSC